MAGTASVLQELYRMRRQHNSRSQSRSPSWQPANWAKTKTRLWNVCRYDRSIDLWQRHGLGHPQCSRPPSPFLALLQGCVPPSQEHPSPRDSITSVHTSLGGSGVSFRLGQPTLAPRHSSGVGVGLGSAGCSPWAEGVQWHRAGLLRPRWLMAGDSSSCAPGNFWFSLLHLPLVERAMGSCCCHELLSCHCSDRVRCILSCLMLNFFIIHSSYHLIRTKLNCNIGRSRADVWKQVFLQMSEAVPHAVSTHHFSFSRFWYGGSQVQMDASHP